MNQSEVEAFIETLENVEREENYGYSFFFVGDDHRLSFATVANSDNEYDMVSNLNREGVFRVNIGVSRETFTALFADSDSETIDYSVLNVFLPHPDYAKQNFICILNPSQDNDERTQKFIIEAHAIATTRFQRHSNK